MPVTLDLSKPIQYSNIVEVGIPTVEGAIIGTTDIIQQKTGKTVLQLSKTKSGSELLRALNEQVIAAINKGWPEDKDLDVSVLDTGLVARFVGKLGKQNQMIALGSAAALAGLGWWFFLRPRKARKKKTRSK